MDEVKKLIEELGYNNFGENEYGNFGSDWGSYFENNQFWQHFETLNKDPEILRKHGHDYRDKWKYHITINKAPEAPAYCEVIAGDLQKKEAFVKYSLLGKLIAKAIFNFQDVCPKIQVIQYKIMPDHVHLIIEVTERLENKVGNEIGAFKTGIANNWRKIKSNPDAQVFTDNYNDKILFSFRSLKDVIEYVKSNPYRLAVRQHRPDFFVSNRIVEIGERKMLAYGNLFLFRNPFMSSLVVHRADTQKVFDDKLEKCRYHTLNNGVIVSPFIAAREKEIRDCVIKSGGRIILISAEGFGGRKKPYKMLFDLCAEGRLLILTPVDYLRLPRREHPTRGQCLDMNNLAIELAKDQPEENQKDKEAEK